LTQIIEKINNHQFLDCNDISEMVYLNSNGKVEAVFFENIKLAGYLDDINTIAFNNQIEEKIKKRCLELYEVEYKEKNLTPNFLPDLYNIIILHIIFHELQHHFQDNSSLNSHKKQLLKQNANHKKKSYEMYSKYHDMFYIEYDADINSMKKTLNFIKKYCPDLNKDSIIEYNSIYAYYICSAYGKGYINTINDKKIVNSPIDFYKVLSKSLDNKKEKRIIKNKIKNLKLCSRNDYTKLLNGFKLSKSTMKFIRNVSNGEIITINLLEDIKYKTRQKIIKF